MNLSIVTVGTLSRNAANVTVQSCLFGVDCESVYTNKETVRLFRLMGPSDKIDQVIKRTSSVRINEDGNSISNNVKSSSS